MATTVATNQFTSELLALLTETFESVQGIFLDKGNSLLETLAGITAQEASIPVGNKCATIAAQITHVCFYLDALYRFIQTGQNERIDWGEIWRTVSVVTPEEWDALRERVRRFALILFEAFALAALVLAEVARVLKPGAVFRVATDIPHYAAWTLERVLSNPEAMGLSVRGRIQLLNACINARKASASAWVCGVEVWNFHCDKKLVTAPKAAWRSSCRNRSRQVADCAWSDSILLLKSFSQSFM